MKTSSLIALSLLAVAGLAGSAMADGRIDTNHQPTGSGGRYDGTDGSGGAFEFTPRNDFSGSQANAGYNGVLGGLGLTNSFYSFCLEETEYLGSPQYSQISTSSSGGGVSGQDGSESDGASGTRTTDSLDARTAYIYQEFRNDGNFGGIGNIGSSSVAVGQSLTSSIQHAIWFIEGEVADISGDANAVAMVAWAAQQVTLHGNTIGNVRVLRLWSNFDPQTGAYSGAGQDGLTLIPVPPAAWAGLSSLAGVAFIGAIRRRKNAAV